MERRKARLVRFACDDRVVRLRFMESGWVLRPIVGETDIICEVELK